MNFKWFDMEELTDANQKNELKEAKLSLIRSLPTEVKNYSEEEIFSAIEQCIELSAVCIADRDMECAETAMRTWQGLLLEGRERRLHGLEMSYSEMVFSRFNALLYSGTGHPGEALKNYEEAAIAEKSCFKQIKADNSLSGNQRLLVGWNCALVISEYQRCAADNSLVRLANDLCEELSERLRWIKPYLGERDDLREAIAKGYTYMATLKYQVMDISGRDTYSAEARRIYDELFAKTGQMYYKILKLRLKTYSMAQDYQRGKLDIYELTDCEKDLVKLQGQMLEPFEVASINGLTAAVLLVKGSAESDWETAAELLAESARLAKKAAEGFEAMAKLNGAGAEISDEAAKNFGTYIGALQTLGNVHMAMEEYELAEEELTRTMKEVDETSYGIPQLSVLTIKAECMLRLAYVELARDDVKKLDFYASQAADMAEEAAESTDMPDIWFIAAQAAALTAEARSAVKDIQGAAAMARRAITAIERLEADRPDEQMLKVKADMQKKVQKAEKGSGFPFFKKRFRS